MSQPVLHGTTIAHARLPAHIHRLYSLQVVAAHESRSAANDLVPVEFELRDLTRCSGRVGARRVAVAVDGAGRAE